MPRRLLSLSLLLSALWLVALPATSETLTLNLRDAEIQTLIDLVAEETGTNFIVDPRVRGRVSVVSGRPVARDELYDLFLGVLRVYGFAAVPGDTAVKIVPDVQAKQSEIPGLFADDTLRADEIVTHVIQTEHVSSAQLVPILRPLVPQGGHLAAATETNSLIVSDTAANVRRIRDIVSVSTSRWRRDSRSSSCVTPARPACPPSCGSWKPGAVARVRRAAASRCSRTNAPTRSSCRAIPSGG
jgi:general secretion pathway protein D